MITPVEAEEKKRAHDTKLFNERMNLAEDYIDARLGEGLRDITICDDWQWVVDEIVEKYRAHWSITIDKKAKVLKFYA